MSKISRVVGGFIHYRGKVPFLLIALSQTYNNICRRPHIRLDGPEQAKCLIRYWRTEGHST